MMDWAFSSEERNTCKTMVRKLLERCPFRSEKDRKVTLKSVPQKQVKGVGENGSGW
jgi:hypothetical protein